MADSMAIAMERIALNIDVRNKLRLGNRFETLYVHGVWVVRSTTMRPRAWIATRGPNGFSFVEQQRPEWRKGKA